MQGPLALSLLLVMAEPSSGAHEVKGLRAAYAVHPSPWILLGITEAHLGGGKCAAAEETLREFFDTCGGCDALDGAAPIAQRLIDQCTPRPVVDAITVAARRRRAADPHLRQAWDRFITTLEGIDEVRAQQVWWLASRGRPVIEAEARHLASKRALFGLRISVDQAQKLLDPLLALDESQYRWLLGAIETAQRNGTAVEFEAPRSRRTYYGRYSPPSTPHAWITLRLGCRRSWEHHGYITIQTMPASEVWAGDTLIGETPISKAKLPAGCAIITAKAIGNRALQTKKKIRVEPNDTKRYQFSLK